MYFINNKEGFLMQVNPKNTLHFIKKFIPSISKKTETALSEPVQSNIQKADPRRIIGNYYVNTFLNSGSQQVLNVIQSTRKELGKIKHPETKAAFEGLYERIINERANIPNLSHRITTLSQKIETIENPAIKQEILAEINTLTSSSRKGFKDSFNHSLEFAEDAADSVNILNDFYANLSSEPMNLYKWIKKGNSWFFDVLSNRKGTPTDYRGGFVTQKKRKMDYKQYLEAYKEAKQAKKYEAFQNSIKQEKFKKFLEVYAPTRPKITDHIYNDEYLKTLDPEVSEVFKKIKEQYGTYVISSNADIDLRDAKYLQEEFRLWKNTGKDNAVFPSIVDINITDFSLKKEQAAGSASLFSNRIKLLGLLKNESKKSQTLRHEMNHINDFKYDYKPRNDFELLYKNIKWQLNKMLYKNKWRQEMKNAGIGDRHREYALTKSCELKSVSVEGNTSAYSDKFKNTLVDTFGLQRWVLDIPENIHLKLEQNFK